MAKNDTDDNTLKVLDTIKDEGYPTSRKKKKKKKRTDPLLNQEESTSPEQPFPTIPAP